MKYLYFLLFFTCNYNIFCQDTIFRFEEKPIAGKILFINHDIIFYKKNNFIKDIPSELVFGYKKNNKLSILYKEKSGPLTSIEMHNYVMGRNLGYKQHFNSFPFAVGFFSSYLYTYRNTRGLTRPPKITSLWFMAVPTLAFTYIKPKTNKAWPLAKRIGYQNTISERNQTASFIGSILGTTAMYIFYFSK